MRLEARLGYVHKGTESLMAGLPVERAAVLAGRVSGDSTVAYALAFARATEAAHDMAVPARALWLRALMAEAIAGGAQSVGDLTHELDEMLNADESLSRALVPEVWHVARREGSGGRHNKERRKFYQARVGRYSDELEKLEERFEIPYDDLKVLLAEVRRG